MSKKEKTSASKKSGTAKKTIPQKDFDFKAHNKKVASSRGEAWRKKLAKGKLDAITNPSQLRKTRAAKGISQQDIIKGTGIKSVAAFARIEKGVTHIEKAIADSIAKKLKVPATNLFKQGRDNMLAAKF